MSKGYKGGDFEREICKKLSAWWSAGLNGTPRDDIFWRSSQSGGRATQRSKFGKTTYGSYGDIAAVDPIGTPLLNVFTIELKRGSSHGFPGDLLDFKSENQSHVWVRCLVQTIRSYEQAGSKGWMMICRRDHRIAVCFMDRLTYRKLHTRMYWPSLRYRLVIQKLGCVDFVGMPLDDFLSRTKPKQIIALTK